MSDTTSQPWLWNVPLPDAISAVMHELRMPVVSMRGAVDLIQQFTSCQTYHHHHLILRTQIDRLYQHVNRLFELRSCFQQLGQQDNNIQQQIEPSQFVQAIINDLRTDLDGLQPAIQATKVDCYILLEARLQPIFDMLPTNRLACLETIQSLLQEGLLTRIRNEQNLVD